MQGYEEVEFERYALGEAEGDTELGLLQGL